MGGNQVFRAAFKKKIWLPNILASDDSLVLWLTCSLLGSIPNRDTNPLWGWVRKGIWCKSLPSHKQLLLLMVTCYQQISTRVTSIKEAHTGSLTILIYRFLFGFFCLPLLPETTGSNILIPPALESAWQMLHSHVCVFGWHLKISCEMAEGEKGAAGREPAECQYQITGRLSAGTHGAGRGFVEDWRKWEFITS